VDQLIEYQRSPLPLARPGISGLGVYEDELLVSLTLAASEGHDRSISAVKGVLLRASARSVRFVLEVDEAFSFLDVALVATSSPPDEPWLLAGATASGETVFQFDARAFLSARGVELDA
jgi:hypothetical protein